MNWLALLTFVLGCMAGIVAMAFMAASTRADDADGQP